MKVRSVTSPTSNWSSKAPDSLLDLSDDSEERDNPEELYAQGIIDAVELQRLKNRAAQRRSGPFADSILGRYARLRMEVSST